MLKLAILLTVATLGLAQSGNETEANKESQNVTTLDLSNQGITSLNDYDFSKYHLLSSVDLSNNDLKHIKETTFTDNINLKKLNLSGNPHLNLPEYSTLLIASIEDLDLSNCNITELPQNIFDGLRDLKRIDLSENPLVKDAIKVSTLLTIMSPKTIILPPTDEKLIREICNELDIIVEIKSKHYTETIKCADVRDGKWNMVTSKESQTSNENTEVEADPEIPPTEPQITQHTSTESKNEEQHTVSTAGTDMEASAKKPEQHVENETDSEFNVHNDSSVPPLPPLEEIIPDVVDNTRKISPEVSHPHSMEHQNVKPQETTKENPTAAPQPLQRGAIDVPIDNAEMKSTRTDTAPKYPEQNKLGQTEEKIASNADDQVKTGASTESSVGTNVLIFLVVAVIIAGVAAFGYKFYKTRRYQAARSCEPVERELKEIVVDRKSNGTSKLVDTIEEEPLMERHENSVEIKEVDDAMKNNAPEQNQDPKAASYDGTTANSANAASHNQTATPAKPPHLNKDDNKSPI